LPGSAARMVSIASIGPGGIEMGHVRRTAHAWQQLQSDRGELKFGADARRQKRLRRFNRTGGN